MRKAHDSVLKRYRNNVRVDPASLSGYLCYYCGLMSKEHLEHQRHLLKVHEVLSQSYQLWSDQTMDALGLRWSESKRPDDDRSGSSSPVSRTPKAKDSDEDDEDYVCEEEEKPSKRRKKDDEKNKKKSAEKLKKEELRRKIDAENKRRKRAEEKKREEKARKDEEIRKMLEEKNAAQKKPVEIKRVQEKPREVVEEVKRPEVTEKRKRRRTEGSRRKDEQSEKDEPEIEALVKKILEESKKKEASRQETEDADIHAEPSCASRKPFEATASTTKYCKICKKGTHYNFASLFSHYFIHHHATIQSFEYYGYNESTLIGKKILTEKEFCQRCIVKFPTPYEYYNHMIAEHMFESVRCQPDFESATHADVEVKLEFRDRILVCGYRFPLNPDEKTTSPAVSSTPQRRKSKSKEPEIKKEVKQEESKEDEEIILKDPKDEPEEDEPKDEKPSTSAAVN